MIYKATIVTKDQTVNKTFPTIAMAAEWLDSNAGNIDATMLIETFNEAGVKTDGFVYSEKI